LAQVIASRGGLAAPEAPFVIEHREALIYMLCEAAEVEHGIMCQYLFAAFSLKQRENEGLSPDEVDAVLRWRKTIAHVATEEMLHLALVHNLLSAIGAAPHLGRPNLPAPAHHYPAGVNLTLVPFGEPALRHFMFLERPEGMDLKGAQGIDVPVHEAVPLMSERDIVPQPQDFATIGHLYRSIEHGFDHLAEKFGERNLFIGPPRAQATNDNFHWPELVAVKDLATAHQAIDTILEQGEGARGDWQDAHFGQYVRILDEYRQMRDRNPAFDPVRPVVFATVRPCEHDETVPRITERVTSRCADLFNVSYEALLQMLQRFFAHTEETDAELTTLASAAIQLMVGVLKPLGDLITTLPLGPEQPDMVAGPSFELFYENDYLMPHRDAAWALLEERIREAANFCGLIQEIADKAIANDLAKVQNTLTAVADMLAGHFGDWGGVSRFASSDAPTIDVDELRRSAGGLTRRIKGAKGAGGDGDLAALFQDAHLAFARGLKTSPAVAQRLLESVLRPLADVSSPPATARPSAKAPDQLKGEPLDSSALDESLWALAQAATSLRTRWSGELGHEARLLEATAALQEMTLRLASDEQTRASRIEELRALQFECQPGIRCAHDGPYLVTNPERFINWLGEEAGTGPQLALCRCGQSAIKPHCDRACARTGFSDAKDPKRVKDRRDRYDGVSLTVFDNRGICQHSGFCTDRLRHVFHTEGTFVTPSGARMDELIQAVRACPSGALSYELDGIEGRGQVDWDGTRTPAIEVSKDGPYRITGAIPLTDERDKPVKRAEGSSLEHYALCRCGHSQNKPFCSGMHWYVDFRDPTSGPGQTSLYEWAGGLAALRRFTHVLYEKYVPDDQALAPLYAEMAPDTPERAAQWFAHALGGLQAAPSADGLFPDPRFDDQQRARWPIVARQAADEILLPADAAFRATFTALIEWQARNTDVAGPGPRWDWLAGSGPSQQEAETTDVESPPAVIPPPEEPILFEQHIKTLFRERDRQSMLFAFDLWSYGDVAAHADDILGRVRAGAMPCDGAWTKERVDAFARWIEAGKPR
jgi:CDGSH-type Zn-finger protein/truncated hemoglobin YjbI